MIRNVVAARGLVAMSIAAVVGTSGMYMEPMQTDNPFVGLIALQNPPVFCVLADGTATRSFTTTFFVASLGLSVLAIVASRAPERPRPRPLPRHQDPACRPTSSLVLSQAPLACTYRAAPNLTWLAIPPRGLYTGVLILGGPGVGTGCIRTLINSCDGGRPIRSGNSVNWSRKTDRVDVERLRGLLFPHVGGERAALWVVRMPSEDAEHRRQLHAEFITATQKRGRVRNRIRGLVATEGVERPCAWTSGVDWPSCGAGDNQAARGR